MTTTGYDGLPADYEYTGFNFAAWTTGTVVSLHWVPWTSDYRDVVEFANDGELDAYLAQNSSRTVPVKKSVQYVRQGVPIRLDVPFNLAYQHNYLRAHNPNQTGEAGDIPRTFYYFIQDVRYVSPTTTELIIQLDVWQSFRRHVRFGRSFVQRGHVGIADSNQMYDNGRVLLSQPEGLDLGSEYSIERVYRKHYGSAQKTNDYDIIVYSTVDLARAGTLENPKLNTSRGSNFGNLPNGASLYWFDNIDEFQSLMMNLSNTPWVTQGIISIQAIPKDIITADMCEDDTTDGGGLGEKKTLHRVTSPHALKPKSVVLGKSWREDLASVKLSGRYKNLKKFLTYPYTVIEITTSTGTPLILKPEAISGADITMMQLTHIAQPGPRIMFSPVGYNKGNGQADTGDFAADDGGEFMDMMTGFFNFPTFSLANNGYLSFMASNSNSLAYQHSAADWSQQRALAGNQLSYDQASAGMELNSTMNSIGNNQAIAMTGLTNVTARQHMGVDLASAAVSGAMGGPPLPGKTGAKIGAAGGVPGAVGGAMMGVASQATNMAHGVIDENSRNTGTNIGVAANDRRTAAANANAGYIRDTNKGLADWAAKGDYANTIAGINAKVQDAKLTQPTTSGQVGGEAFNLAVHGWLLSAKVKMVQGGAMRAIGDFWLRYGYAVNRFVDLATVPLSVMESFTYWQFKEVYVTSAYCPEYFKQTIRGILEKGVTVWTNPDKMGRIDYADNEPNMGVYLNVQE